MNRSALSLYKSKPRMIEQQQFYDTYTDIVLFAYGGEL